MAKAKKEEVDTGQPRSSKDVLAAFKKINQNVVDTYKKSRVAPTEANLIKKLCFESPQLTYLFSGFSYDRIHQLQGPEQAGKSTIALYMASQLQKKLPEIHPGKQIVLYIDFERTFDPKYAQRLGLNIGDDNFVLIRPDDMEDAFSQAEMYIKSDAIACVVFDSDAAAPTKSQAESEYGKADFGRGALVMASSLKKMNIIASNYTTPWIQISQERASMATYGAAFASTGGNAIKFFASTRNRITKIEELTKLGETVGIKIRVRNYKNKTGMPWRDAEVNLYFDTGINSDLEYIDFIKKFELISVAGGGNFSSEEFGFKLRGQPALEEWLTSHPVEYNILKQRVTDKLLSENELDAQNVRPEDDEDPDGKKYLEEMPPDLTEDLSDAN